jgi:hypothetical protein
MKKTKRWSAEHQSGFNAWRKHLAQGEARASSAGKRVPKSAWDLAVAQAQAERNYWSKVLLKARNLSTKRFGPEIFEEARS